MTRPPRNLAASARERLFRQARDRGEDFQLTLQCYAVERLLYRLAQSPYRNRFIVKGATLYRVWSVEAYRPTRDLDLLGHGSPRMESVAACFRAFCSLAVEPDGLLFLADSVRTEEIRKSEEYRGIRVRLKALLAEAHINLQVDVGFGDLVVPAPEEVEFPTLLGGPAPHIRAYTRESVVAEKFHAAALLGEANTRMKDFYDLFTLPRLFPFYGLTLTKAIEATFERRGTPMPTSFPIRANFFDDGARAGQWRAYLERNGLDTAPKDFTAIGETLRRFLFQPYQSLATGVEFRNSWPPGGYWQRFRLYPEYRHSGVVWLGEIPSHWTVMPLKRIGRLRGGAGFPENEQGVQSEELPFFKVGDMTGVGNEREMGICPNTVSEATARRLRAFVFPPETIIFAKVGAALLLNRRRILTRRSCIDNNMMGFIPERCNSGWAMYWLSSLDLRQLANPGAVPSVNEGQMRNTPAIVPPVQEQQEIAHFLGRETAKVDTLVAKKERLIELLQNKRDALIFVAVTKGLNPGSPMKGSGVDWLGIIPAHWSAIRTKYVARLETGHTPSRQHPEYWEDCTIPWFGLADVWQIRDGRKEYVSETNEKVSELGLANSAARLLPKSTVILSRTASVGFSAIMAVDMATTQDFVNWVCGPRIRPEYLLYVFRSMTQEFRRLTMGSTHQTIYMPDVGRFTTPLPPLEEQDQIVAFVRREAKRIDELIDKVGEAIRRIRELRTALISAAVTGKIDVREEIA